MPSVGFRLTIWISNDAISVRILHTLTQQYIHIYICITCLYCILGIRVLRLILWALAQRSMKNVYSAWLAASNCYGFLLLLFSNVALLGKASNVTNIGNRIVRCVREWRCKWLIWLMIAYFGARELLFAYGAPFSKGVNT